VSVADRGTALGLRALARFAGSSTVDRLRVRRPAERAIYRAARGGFRVAGVGARTFTRARALTRPARLAAAQRTGLFDLTPTEEQQMLQAACAEFAARVLRTAAAEAERVGAPSGELLAQAGELGLTLLGVPEQAGGAVSERSAVTGVLVAEALAHGDMSLALALLAPAGVATALSLWGDADQQATYLPTLVGDDPPAAALALLEVRPLFDPLTPATRAHRDGDDFVLIGAKALVPRGTDAELLLVGAALESGPGLFVVETASAGVFVKGERSMGLRGAGASSLLLDDVRVSSAALLAGGDPAVYVECVRRARLGWCGLAIGCARAVLDYVIPYVNERVAFGEPVSHRQSVAFAVSDMAIELEGMRLATLRAAARADAGADFAREAALARALSDERGARIGSDGVQLLGGHGYVTDHPVERWYRDLRAVGVMEGALLV
jgi:alkylation response protein AidB-like acyl-CoA dehydrogenase